MRNLMGRIWENDNKPWGFWGSTYKHICHLLSKLAMLRIELLAQMHLCQLRQVPGEQDFKREQCA